MTIFRRRAGLFALLALLMTMLVMPSLSSAQESGTISVVGSGIVAPVFEALAAASEAEAELDVNITGTSAGLTALCNGEADIALANRPLSIDEEGGCLNNNVTFVELLIGQNIAAFVAHPDQDFALCLSAIDANTILEPSAEGTLTTWDQVIGDFPIVDIAPQLPAQNTALYALLDGLIEGDGLRADADYADDEQAIIDTVSATNGTLGVVSLSSALEAGDAVQILEASVGDVPDCAAPSAENVENRLYAVADSLYAYVNTASLEKAGLSDLLDDMVGEDAAAVVVGLGISAPTTTAYETARTALADGLTGRQFSSELTEFEISPSVSGAVTISGSPIAISLFDTTTQIFSSIYPGVVITPTLQGEVAGLRQLCNGEIDIAVIYEAPSTEVNENCAANNISTVTVDLGAEAVVLVANAGTDFLDCLTTDQLATIWSAASTDTVTTWDQVNPDFPDTTITLFAPETGSDITDLLLTRSAGAGAVNRVDTELDDDVLYRAAATANVEGALTYMSWPQYNQVLENEQANIQLVGVGDDCVTPSAATVSNGSYVLARPAQLLINEIALARPEVQSLLWFLFSDEAFTLLGDSNLAGIEFGDLPDKRADLQAAFAQAQTAANDALAAETFSPEVTAEPGSTDAEATAEAELETAATEELVATEEAEPTAEAEAEVETAATEEAESADEAEATPDAEATEEA
ncbi:MAG: substrate-binding domain-containing protein [Burkholderiales bacterium]|nr:substrate-binding domain-containing protein [Anaerolineae bacterium]